MAVEMFLKVEGVVGGSRNYHHKGWADVLSWTWGLDRGQGGMGDAMRMNSLSLTKATGIDSTALMVLFAAGKPIKKAEISVVPVVGKRDAQQKYVAITLEDVIVQSITTGGSAEESVFKENITLLFGKITYEYHHYADVATDGAAAALKSYTFGWDLVANAALPS